MSAWAEVGTGGIPFTHNPRIHDIMEPFDLPLVAPPGLEFLLEPPLVQQAVAWLVGFLASFFGG